MPQFRILSLAIALAMPGAALAQSTGIDSATDLDEVVVTATRTPIALGEAIAPTQVVDREMIERSQATSLQDLLRGRAGINLGNSGGPGKQTSLFMRGTNSSHTLVLIDGVRVNSADFAAAAFQDIPVEQIERIEIVRGPASSLYGSEAIGGVIQIFTRRDKGGFAPHFQLGGGSNGLREASGGFGGNGERGWFGTDIAYQRTDGINACRGSEALGQGCYADEPDRDGYRNLSLSLRGGYELADTLSVEGSALRAEAENEYDGFYNYSETVQQVINGKLRYAPNQRVAVTIDAGRSDSESDNYSDGVYASTSNSHRDTASVQADIAVAAGQVLTAGADWYQDHLDSSTEYLVDSRDNTAVFVQYQGAFGGHQLQAGLRNDDNEQFGNHTTGTLGWGMALGNGLKFSATYGTAFKAPTFSDLYDPWSGVPDLRPEESESLNLGIAQAAAHWNWALDMYETRIDDLITYDSTTWMMSQVERARIRGAEFTFATAVAGWDLSTQFSHVDPRNHSPGAQYDNQLARRARNTARVDLDRGFGDWRIGSTLNAAGERFDDAANDLRLGGYATLDLRLEYAFGPEWSLQARATNVFDRDYETVAWYNQPGREYGLRLKYQPAVR
ncbi:TonB-dependent vitamin B12 receptor [Lysobacter sp. GX 14042]|uniref:TonB-dependent vitamin B12 receptor n=1 Tax=Lysobacter sp. GX 14042 TaxID=2907155 RepID=UPI001F43E49B|nr:TonB-dependent vitamin B12 receptor [Lysobacter sp. GX 14042]MCE7033088.1 TonB-dependent vitamin B12 receptor [Lysobacter sp. GX 14042]